jgi:hypothetical protein
MNSTAAIACSLKTLAAISQAQALALAATV